MPAERGFQKLGGRKLPSVLAGGDPYGGNYGAFEKETMGQPSSSVRDSFPEAGARNLSGSSFYRDSQGFHGDMAGGLGSPTLPPSRTGSPVTRDFAGREDKTFGEGLAVMRPGPARTPVQQNASVTSLNRTPTPRVASPDAVGRSLSIHDASRGSRFTESV